MSERLTKWDAPVRPKSLWSRLTGGKRWFESNFVYIPYVAIILLQIPDLYFGKPHTHYVAAFNIGLNVGLIFMTFLQRTAQGVSSYRDKHMKQLMEMEAEYKVRRRYEAKYGPL